MCIRFDQHWHCQHEDANCKGWAKKKILDDPIPPKWRFCEEARRIGMSCPDPRVVEEHLALCCPMHHTRRMRQLEELWKSEWKSQVFDHYNQKQKHLSDREEDSLRLARKLEKQRWDELQACLEPIYTQLGNKLHDLVRLRHGRTFYEHIEHIMVNFVKQAHIECVVKPERKDKRERERQAAAAAEAEIAAAAAGPVPPIPPKSAKRRQRSDTSVREDDLQRAQDALRQMSLGAAGGSAPAETRPLPPIPAKSPARSIVTHASASAAIAGPSSSSSPSADSDDDDEAANAGVDSINHAFRPPSRGSSASSSSDEDSESEEENEKTLLVHRDF